MTISTTFRAVNAAEHAANGASSRAINGQRQSSLVARAAALCGTEPLARRTRAPHRSAATVSGNPPCSTGPCEQGATSHLLPLPAGRAGMVAPRLLPPASGARGDRRSAPLNAAISALTLMVVAANDHRARRLGLSTTFNAAQVTH